jgi:hypothetical protein
MASPIQQHIRRLVAIETASQASDASLLEQFVAQRDESAFALLLKRHGPMVLRLARRLQWPASGSLVPQYKGVYG